MEVESTVNTAPDAEEPKYETVKEIEDILVEIYEEIGIGLKAGIGRGKNAEDAAYMADIGLEEIRANNNEMWTWVVEKEY